MTVIPLSRRGPAACSSTSWSCRPRPADPDPELNTHEGYEWLYVIDGHLRLVLGEHDLVLPPGEAAEFDTRVPHWFANEGRRPGGAARHLRRAGRAGARCARGRAGRTQGRPAPG